MRNPGSTFIYFDDIVNLHLISPLVYGGRNVTVGYQVMEFLCVS